MLKSNVPYKECGRSAVCLVQTEMNGGGLRQGPMLQKKAIVLNEKLHWKTGFKTSEGPEEMEILPALWSTSVVIGRKKLFSYADQVKDVVVSFKK